MAIRNHSFATPASTQFLGGTSVRVATSRPQEPFHHPISECCEHCGRAFSAYSYLLLHQRSCKPRKRDLSSLLDETKQFWEQRKRRKLTAPPLDAPLGATVGMESDAPQPPAVVPEEEPEEMDLDVPVAQRKAQRQRRLPLRFRDDVPPEPLPTVEPTMPENEERDPANLDDHDPPVASFPTQPRVLVVKTSKRNTFRVSKTYMLPEGQTLTHDPDGTATLYKLANNSQSQAVEVSRPGRYGPFTTRTAFELAEWYWKSTQKSFSDFEKLINIFGDSHFNIPDAISVNWRASFKALGANREDLSEEEGGWIQDDGWKSTPIYIDVPFHRKQKNSGVEKYLVGHLRHRNILSVIKEKIANADDSQQFHYQPYRATWQPDPNSPELELYGELYASRAFLEANKEVQEYPSTPLNEGLERVVVSLMFWSDGTRLSNFGSASLWPCYLFFGNESKYRRCQPSELLGQQVAYFIKLSDTFKDYLKERNGGKVPTDALLAHCVREVFQGQWCVLLGEDLIDAMRHGIILLCPDGKLRCFYPRIFTYSADYPEKILIAGVRNNGGCPCHRCFVKKSDLFRLGAPADTERQEKIRSEQEQRTKVAEAQEVIASGYAIDTAQIEAILKPFSLVPTETALSNRLSSINFEVLPALVVDLMHEFEIGVWKNLFIHLIRLFDAFTHRGGEVTLTAELDARYRATPAFGRDTIRRFNANASEMKRRAARDYEDLLQCAIPAFESLLPEPHNTHLMRLLYMCAQWHALAKLRLHHDLTLALLDYTTVRLGAQMRLFNRDTCETTVTRELQKEAEARARREGKGKGKGTASRKPAKLGVFTIKFHFLGDYSSIIRKYGTTDSYSTETGELFHRTPKAWFERTDKRNFEVQLSEIERRQARLDLIRSNLPDSEASQPRIPDSLISNLTTSERSSSSPEAGYVIGLTQRSPIDLLCFARDPNLKYADPYAKDAIPKMKQHLLPHILRRLGFSSAEAVEKCDWKNVALREGRLFSHKLLRINYTTYDVRHEQDVIHLDTPQCNVLLLNSDSRSGAEHPYIYARVIGIFHANVSYLGQLPDGSFTYTPHRIDFCWAHWYQFNPANDEFALQRVAPFPLDRPEALGFFDPADILRAVHLVPQFSLGRFEKKTASTGRFDNKHELWNIYFINKFADRDLFMRYQYRMSVGHEYMYTTKDFPPLSPVPSIPADFDYCLEIPTNTHVPDAADANLPQPTGGGDPGPPPGNSFLEPSVQPNMQPVAGEGLQGRADGECGRGGQGIGEGVEPEDDQGEELNDYDDDLDDNELLAHEEMYGTQVYC